MGLVHPVLIILFVYPVVGATIRLGILAREKRLDLNPIAATVPTEHAQHGAWVTGGVLLAVLIGLSHSLLTDAHTVIALLGLSALVMLSYGRLLATRLAWQRGLWALACGCGLLLLGLHPSVERLSDQPWTLLFWQSHFWMGWLLSALLLANTALQPLIGIKANVRVLHISINVVIALLLAMQAISGTRNLLLMGVSLP
ncbi:DUF4079 domain-containing protein [Parasynechococcus sp.]|jgi:hypothetical protein|uniref:DUF4079 domain-containing protein n=1 Tax=Parasynechococcus sp. TaxID=3101203 RepID=UPI0037038EC3